MAEDNVIIGVPENKWDSVKNPAILRAEKIVKKCTLKQGMVATISKCDLLIKNNKREDYSYMRISVVCNPVLQVNYL
jgi:hypothetical protein